MSNPNFNQQKSTLTPAQIALLSAITPSAIPFISTMNQNVNISANPTFNSLTLTSGFSPTTLNLSAGTASTPSLYFAGHTDTGYYQQSPGVIGISCSTVGVVIISASGMTVYQPLTVQNAILPNVVLAGNGTANQPAYSFSGASSNGMFCPGADGIAFSIAGVNAGYISNGTFRYSTFLGNDTGGFSTNGNYNCGYGFQSGKAIVNGYQNTLVGALSGTSLVTGFNNVCLGYLSGTTNTSDSNVIAIGYGASAASNTTIIGNGSTVSNYIGGQFLSTSQTAGAPTYSWAIDTDTGLAYIGPDNISLNVNGTSQLSVATTGVTINGILNFGSLINIDPTGGLFVLKATGGAGSKILIGVSGNNTCVGYKTPNPTLITGNYNCVFGYGAMQNALTTTTISSNIALGTGALTNVGSTATTSTKNIGIGQNAGSTLTAGTQNIYIGDSAQASGVSVTNEIVIGASQTGLGSATTCIGNSGTTTNFTAYGIPSFPNRIIAIYQAQATQTNTISTDTLTQFPTALFTQNNSGLFIVSGTGNTFWRNVSGGSLLFEVAYTVCMTTGSTNPLLLNTYINVSPNATVTAAAVYGQVCGNNSTFNNVAYTVKNTGYALCQVPNNSYIMIISNETSSGTTITFNGTTSNLYGQLSIRQV